MLGTRTCSRDPPRTQGHVPTPQPPLPSPSLAALASVSQGSAKGEMPPVRLCSLWKCSLVLGHPIPALVPDPMPPPYPLLQHPVPTAQPAVVVPVVCVSQYVCSAPVVVFHVMGTIQVYLCQADRQVGD